MAAGSKWYTDHGLVGMTIWVTPEFRERVNRAIRKKSFQEDRTVLQREFIELAVTEYMENMDA